MTVELLVSLCVLFIVIVIVIYKSYLYIKAREEETQTSDILTNLLPFIKSADEGKEYSLI
tara:strand:- start:455 stop:634 length:180 start_codon:yes stop_codon:yes gene_type:complete